MSARTGELTTAEDFAALGHMDVVISPDGHVAQLFVMGDRREWHTNGMEVAEANMPRLAGGPWRLLRRGPESWHRVETATTALEVDGPRTWTAKDAALMVSDPGLAERAVVAAMCATREIARDLAALLNAREVDAHPWVVAAVQRAEDAATERRRHIETLARQAETNRAGWAAVAVTALALFGDVPAARAALGVAYRGAFLADVELMAREITRLRLALPISSPDHQPTTDEAGSAVVRESGILIVEGEVGDAARASLQLGPLAAMAPPVPGEDVVAGTGPERIEPAGTPRAGCG